MLLPRLALKACIAFAVLSITPGLAIEGRRPDRVSFYFAAHEDDWQLFMNPTAFEDVAGGAAKTVFVHVTAGDAGLGAGNGGRKFPYYQARENGAEAAIRFMVDADDGAPAEKSSSHVTFNGHSIYRIGYGSAAGYFLRLPDGSLSGAGYPSTGFQSLRRLADGEIATLSAVDGSTTYNGWRDLTGTLRAIVEYERAGAALAQINVPDPDPRNNPNDHPDHLMTAKAALDAASSLACVRRVYFVDYASARLPENLSPAQRDKASSVFAATLSGIMELDHPTSWHHYDDLYVGKNYFRVEEPVDRCGADNIAVGTARP
jgi:LmbE family N-acetylglucosaminyl deacetylase